MASIKQDTGRVIAKLVNLDALPIKPETLDKIFKGFDAVLPFGFVITTANKVLVCKGAGGGEKTGSDDEVVFSESEVDELNTQLEALVQGDLDVSDDEMLTLLNNLKLLDPAIIDGLRDDPTLAAGNELRIQRMIQLIDDDLFEEDVIPVELPEDFPEEIGIPDEFSDVTVEALDPETGEPLELSDFPIVEVAADNPGEFTSLTGLSGFGGQPLDVPEFDNPLEGEPISEVKKCKTCCGFKSVVLRPDGEKNKQQLKAKFLITIKGIVTITVEGTVTYFYNITGASPATLSLCSPSQGFCGDEKYEITVGVTFSSQLTLTLDVLDLSALFGKDAENVNFDQLPGKKKLQKDGASANSAKQIKGDIGIKELQGAKVVIDYQVNNIVNSYTYLMACETLTFANSTIMAGPGIKSMLGGSSGGSQSTSGASSGPQDDYFLIPEDKTDPNISAVCPVCDFCDRKDLLPKGLRSLMKEKVRVEDTLGTYSGEKILFDVLEEQFKASNPTARDIPRNKPHPEKIEQGGWIIIKPELPIDGSGRMEYIRYVKVVNYFPDEFKRKKLTLLQGKGLLKDPLGQVPKLNDGECFAGAFHTHPNRKKEFDGTGIDFNNGGPSFEDYEFHGPFFLPFIVRGRDENDVATYYFNELDCDVKNPKIEGQKYKDPDQVKASTFKQP